MFWRQLILIDGFDEFDGLRHCYSSYKSDTLVFRNSQTSDGGDNCQSLRTDSVLLPLNYHRGKCKTQRRRINIDKWKQKDLRYSDILLANFVTKFVFMRDSISRPFNHIFISTEYTNASILILTSRCSVDLCSFSIVFTIAYSANALNTKI